MELTFTLENISQTAEKILELANDKGATVLTFYGKMGAGKTTLIKAICEKLGVIDTVQSPTFAIINQYQTADGTPVFHFDLYRLEKLQDALNIGAEEILYSGEICLIEWPELLEPILPENHMKIKIEELDDKTRRIIL